MGEITNYRPGEFCRVDLCTFDNRAAIKFYNELFGWEPKFIELYDKSLYTSFMIDGKPVAGMHRQMDELRHSGVPPFWLASISTNDIEESYKKLGEIGGEIDCPITLAGESGKFYILKDNEKAVIAVWQKNNLSGSALKGVHGTYCWAEHGTRDRYRTIEFYEKLFGWRSSTEKMGEHLYTTFSLGEDLICGLYEISPDMPDVPPHWLVYFQVDDIDRALETTLQKKGKVIMPKSFYEGVGHFALIQDPQGAVLGLLQ